MQTCADNSNSSLPTQTPFQAKTSLGASTKYEVEVEGLSYGRCFKHWDDCKRTIGPLKPLNSRTCSCWKVLYCAEVAI